MLSFEEEEEEEEEEEDFEDELQLFEVEMRD